VKAKPEVEKEDSDIGASLPIIGIARKQRTIDAGPAGGARSDVDTTWRPPGGHERVTLRATSQSRPRAIDMVLQPAGSESRHLQPCRQRQRQGSIAG